MQYKVVGGRETGTQRDDKEGPADDEEREKEREKNARSRSAWCISRGSVDSIRANWCDRCSSQAIIASIRQRARVQNGRTKLFRCAIAARSQSYRGAITLQKSGGTAGWITAISLIGCIYHWVSSPATRWGINKKWTVSVESVANLLYSITLLFLEFLWGCGTLNRENKKVSDK